VQQQLPDPVLFQQIKACASWADCLALLHSHGPQLDAMLLSSLCTHSVHLYELQQYHNMMSATATHPAQMPPQDSNHPSKSAAGNRHSSSSSGTSRAGDIAVQQQYMACLSSLALQLALSGSCRPQQYSNVLWCFARCSYSLPPAWMHAYLNQVRWLFVSGVACHSVLHCGRCVPATPCVCGELMQRNWRARTHEKLVGVVGGHHGLVRVYAVCVCWQLSMLPVCFNRTSGGTTANNICALFCLSCLVYCTSHCCRCSSSCSTFLHATWVSSFGQQQHFRHLCRPHSCTYSLQHQGQGL
jgi:hypothetical protein